MQRRAPWAPVGLGLLVSGMRPEPRPRHGGCRGGLGRRLPPRVATRRPLLAPRPEIPDRRNVDPRLIVGAPVFGFGWGLVGLCPGPALTILMVAPRPAATFVASMIVGVLLFRLMPSAVSKPMAVQEADA